MALQLQETVHVVEVLENNTLQVCICKQVIDTDTNLPVGGPEMWRYSLRPGSSLVNQPQKVVDIANSVWNQE